MITEKEIKNEVDRWADSRLNGHDVSAFIQGAKWAFKKLNINIVKQEIRPICNRLGEVQQTDIDYDDCRNCNGTGKINISSK